MLNYSIIIPHKNTPELLQRCLDSIPQRDDVEVIVVDNNSSTAFVDFNPFPYCKRENVIVVSDSHSIGAGGARNTGLACAQGKWAIFADADDYFNNDFFDVFDKYVNSYYDVVFVNHYKRNGNKVGFLFKYVENYEEGSQDSIRYRVKVPWGRMVNRKFLSKYHIKFEDSIAGNDIYFGLQIGFFARTICVDKARVYNYIVSQNSITHRKNRNKDFYVCFFKHHYQINEFLKFVGHQKWCKSLFREYVAFLFKRGVKECCLAMVVYYKYRDEIIYSKDYFVNELKKRL